MGEIATPVVHTPPSSTSLSALLCAAENSGPSSNAETPKLAGGFRYSGPTSLLGRTLEAKEDCIQQSDRGVCSPCGSSGAGLKPPSARPAPEHVVTNEKATMVFCGTAEATERHSSGAGNEPGLSVSKTELAKLHRQTQQKAKKQEWLKRHKGEVLACELGERQKEYVQDNLISIDDPEFWEGVISSQELTDRSSQEEVEPKHKRQKTAQ